MHSLCGSLYRSGVVVLLQSFSFSFFLCFPDSFSFQSVLFISCSASIFSSFFFSAFRVHFFHLGSLFIVLCEKRILLSLLTEASQEEAKHFPELPEAMALSFLSLFHRFRNLPVSLPPVSGGGGTEKPTINK